MYVRGMEPAMVLCTVTAAATLGLWSAGRVRALVASLSDRLAGSFVDAGPNRALATAVLAVVGFVAVPRPSAAEPVPPIVRLAEQRAEPSRPAPPGGLATTTYEVVGGDSLWCIAASAMRARSGERPTSAAVAGFWPRVYEANRPLIGDDPNLILPGQQLTIPDP